MEKENIQKRVGAILYDLENGVYQYTLATKNNDEASEVRAYRMIVEARHQMRLLVERLMR
jgi:hypothetical protein